jgi:tetratricopeptide (TPR) repeat protein
MADQAYTMRRFTEAATHAEAAVMHARAGPDQKLQLDAELRRFMFALVGPVPSTTLIRMGDDLMTLAAGHPQALALAMRFQAIAIGIAGRLDEATALARRSIDLFTDLGATQDVIGARIELAKIRQSAKDFSTAEREFRRAIAEAERIGSPANESWASLRLAELLIELGRHDEAQQAVEASTQYAGPMLILRCLATRARIRAARGDPGAADDVAAFVGMVDAGHTLQKGDLLVHAAEVMLATGHLEAAAGYARDVIACALVKEDPTLEAAGADMLARVDAAVGPGA